ncbi:hypothetical protein J007_05288 [Cryptococcus neoformans]|nr:hypothetical protein J007_05288 [Cryptococcus neoformans var. grubii]OXC59146.1 hypothetical protein C358_05408 [Cryptococcus neoformans var. grubii MW-RSA852]
MTTSPQLPELSRRRFGSFGGSRSSAPPQRPSSSASNTSTSPVPTPSPNLMPPPPQRTRSASSTSSSQANNAAAFDITQAADKAHQWLSNWAPRGEGRGREFLINGLNGVASVASTVSSGLNVRHEKDRDVHRSLSFLGPSTSNSVSPSTSPEGRFHVSTSPPGPIHTQSTPQFGVTQPESLVSNGTRKVLPPANLARLGHAATTNSTPTISSGPSAVHQQRPATLHSGSTVSLPSANHRSSIHGPSHLGPNSPTHRRTSSSHSNHRPFPFANGSHGMSSKSSSMSRSSSMTGVSAGPYMRNLGTPYKIGFQPQGVRSDRTEEYMEARRAVEADREVEEGRLSRRWAKLVDLHFNPTVSQAAAPTMTRSSSSNFSLSSLGQDRRRSLLSFEGALDAMKQKDIFKGFKAGSGPGGDEGRKRAAEQAIVKWEDDSEVRKCRICASSFSLSNRKHHCRLCGRIVCSLPPTPPALLAVQIQLFAPADPNATSTQTQAGLPSGTRREKCSLLLVADWKTGRGEEVEEGFVGWMRMEDGEGSGEGQAIQRRRKSQPEDGIGAVRSGDAPTQNIPLPQQPKEVQVKGMRVCRECWAVVSRKQKMQDRQRVTGFARLYQALRTLQAEIEDLAADFEEQLSELVSSTDPIEPPDELLTLHRQLIALFTQYEQLSKRISGLPCQENGSQASVQSAIARSAAVFMTKEMVKLQAIQSLQKRSSEAKKK